MNEGKKTILAVFAHPDDESMGPGGTLAKYAAAGHHVKFVTATDGGAGRYFEDRPDDNTVLREARRRETFAAAEVLGVDFLGFMGWEDGRLSEVDILDVETRIAGVIRREKPDVLMTFHGSGISYHPDHRIIALALMGAFHGAARGGWYADSNVESLPPHAPRKLYYFTLSRSLIESVDWPREIFASSDDEITTVIDTRETADTRWRAIQAHETQRNGPPFDTLYDAGVFEKEFFVRVFPSPGAEEPLEEDLLSGL
jgi:LmbE family N-acetylglucosaminyl deacetylase